MCLPVLFGLRVIEFECAYSSACHEKECDILDFFDFLLIGVLSRPM